MEQADFSLSTIGMIEKEVMSGSDEVQLRYSSKQNQGYFYVWDIGHECIRKKYYSVVDPRAFSWGLRKKLLVGSGIHNSVQYLLREYGYNTEVPIIKHYDDFGFDVSVKVDALLGSVENPHRLVEIKSAAYFQYIKSPYKSNVAQLQQYMDIVDVDHGYLLYISNETGDMKEFRVERDDDIIFNNLMKLEIVRDCIINDLLPPKKRISSICRECVYKMECDYDEKL